MTCKTLSTFTAGLILLGVTGGPGTGNELAAQDAGQLASYLPGSANTIAVVRLGQILQSDRAKRDDWAQMHQERFLAGAAAIPPWVDTLVVGSLVHPSVPEHAWSVAVTRRPEEVNLVKIAAEEGGHINYLAGKPAVHSPRNAYVILATQNLIGVYSPAYRQDAVRWLESIADGPTDALRPYLMKAASADGQLIMAMDLADMPDPEHLKAFLGSDERFRPYTDLIDRLTALVLGIQGVTFSAVVGETIDARLAVDFSDDVGTLAPALKALFLAIIGDLGLMIDELDQAAARADGKSVVMTMELSDESLRRIVSLIATPHAQNELMHTVMAEPPTAVSPTAAAAKGDPSVTYFSAVVKILNDLQRANNRAKDYAKTAMWHDNFARMIENLPADGVDPELARFGVKTASRLRALAASLRGQAVEVNAQQRTLVYNTEYSPGWAWVNVWGGFGYGEPTYKVTSNLQEVRERQAEAVVAGTKERNEIWQMLNEDFAEVRELMIERHGWKPRPRSRP